MPVRVTIIILFACLLTLKARAQFRYDAEHRHAVVTPGYFAVLDLASGDGAFRHGAVVGAAYSLVNKYRIRQQRKTGYNRIIDRDVYAGLNLATYRRRDLHQALMIAVGPEFRLTLPEGLYFQFGTSVGYLRTFLAGGHYSFDAGEVQKVRGLGHNYFALQGQAGAGWNFYKSHDFPVTLSAAAGLGAYFPLRDGWQMQAHFQAGIGVVIARIREQYE